MYTAPNLLSFSRIVATIVVFVLVIVNQPSDSATSSARPSRNAPTPPSSRSSASMRNTTLSTLLTFTTSLTQRVLTSPETKSPRTSTTTPSRAASPLAQMFCPPVAVRHPQRAGREVSILARPGSASSLTPLAARDRFKCPFTSTFSLGLARGPDQHQ